MPPAASDANTDVIVTIRPKLAEDEHLAKSTYPVGYFEETYGSLATDPMTIPEDPAPLPEAFE